MSIGLVSLAVLFPMSVLRSIKASQFTNATDTRFNAEAMIDVYPNLVRNPDYSVVAGAPNPHAGENFVVDPLGYAIINQTNNLLSNYFGNDSTLPQPAALGNPINPGSWTFRRYYGTWGLESWADHLVTLPDSWNLQYEGIATNLQTDPKALSPLAGPTQLDVTGLGAQGLQLSATNATRVVIFSSDGVTSQTRTITSLGSVAAGDTVDTLKWTEDVDSTGTFTNAKDLNANGILDDNSLPTSFANNPNNPIGKVRIEQQERRYTWMLTVRKNSTGTNADVDVVVFFKRPIEQFQVGQNGQAGDEVLFQAAFQAGNTQVAVTYPTNNKPFMRKGNYIFDANNAFWYRISNVSPPTKVNNTTESVTITLDVPANLANTNGPLPPRAMFPRAVVDVYPIGTKS